MSVTQQASSPASPGPLIILGGGAAGLALAHFLARAGKGQGVVLMERGDPCGAKLALAGGGRCNLTNLDVTPADYASDNPHFVKSALARFGPWDAIGLAGDLGLAYEVRDDNPDLGALGQRVFLTARASTFARKLEESARAGGVDIRTKTSVERVEPHDTGTFTVHTSAGPVHARAVVNALGSPAWPSCGATDAGLAIARSLGLPVVAPSPALCPLEVAHHSPWHLAELAGISLPVTLTTPSRTVTAPVVITHHGLSGPAVLTATLDCPHASKADTACIHVDFLPGQPVADLLEAHPRKPPAGALATLLPKRLAELLAAQLPDRNCAELTKAHRQSLAEAVHSYPLTHLAPAARSGYTRAEAARGGIDTRALDSTSMAVRHMPHLYCIGEVVDVTGRLGGFNIHWALASAHAVAQQFTQ